MSWAYPLVALVVACLLVTVWAAVIRPPRTHIKGNTGMPRTDRERWEAEASVYRHALGHVKRFGSIARSVVGLKRLSNPDAPRSLHQTRQEWKEERRGRGDVE